MALWIKNPKVTVKVDPTNVWGDQPIKDLMEGVGALRQWAMQYSRVNGIAPRLRQHMTHAYSFDVFELEGGTVQDDFIFMYNGDLDIHPVLTYEYHHTNEVLALYPHSMVGIKEPDRPWFMTRMD